MSVDYAAIAAEVALAFAEVRQGTVTLSRTVYAAGPNAWTPGAPTTTSYELDATVRRVEQKYVDGTLIVATDDQINFSVPPIAPAMTDAFTVDGKLRTLKALRPIPAAGTPVMYIAFVAG